MATQCRSRVGILKRRGDKTVPFVYIVDCTQMESMFDRYRSVPLSRQSIGSGITASASVSV